MAPPPGSRHRIPVNAAVQNEALWKPSKYTRRRGRLRASRDVREVGIGSRLNADLVAAVYDRELRLHASGRLLDLGCGRVPLHQSYKNFVSESTCVDWANTAHKNPHLDLECDLTQALPFADREFDTILLSDVLEHIPTPEALFREMARVLAVDGKLVMNVPFLYQLHEEPYDFYRYTEFALRRFVDVSGLELVLLQSVGGAVEVLVDIAAKLLARVPFIGQAAADSLQWLARGWWRTQLGTRLARRTGRKFPLGYFLVARKNG
jgi:SAM-dependent methyltransferase